MAAWVLPNKKLDENIKRLHPVAFHEKYTMIRHLGQGTYGDVFQVENKETGHMHAIKFTNIPTLSSVFISEITSVLSLNHPNVIKYTDIDYYKCEYGNAEEVNAFGIMMEVMDGDLSGVLRGNYTFGDTKAEKERITNQILFQILSAVNYIHSRNILHGDIKPENIFFKKTGDDRIPIRVILGDFGGADGKFCNNKQLIMTSRYSLPYLPPDVARNEYFDSDYTYNLSADIWALGVTFYELIMGFELRSMEFEDLPSFQKEMETGAFGILKLMLQINPNKRSTSFNLLQSHMFDDIREEMMDWYSSQGVSIFASKSCLSKVMTNFVPTKNKLVDSTNRKNVMGWIKSKYFEEKTFIGMPAVIMAMDHYDRFDALNDFSEVDRVLVHIVPLSLIFLSSMIYSGSLHVDIASLLKTVNNSFTHEEVMACCFNLLKAMNFNLNIANFYDIATSKNKDRQTFFDNFKIYPNAVYALLSNPSELHEAFKLKKTALGYIKKYKINTNIHTLKPLKNK